MDFTPADLAQLAAHGLSAAEAESQLARLRRGRSWLRLARPCTLNDGIRILTDDHRPALLERFADAAMEGRVVRFVPASGAATRMFQPLQAADAPELTLFLDEFERFPFADELTAVLADRDHHPTAALHGRDLPLLLGALLEPAGLDYARQPKGLLPFHRGPDGVRSAFVEHLAESARLVGAGNRARLHFTVSPEHRPRFEEQLKSWRPRLEKTFGVSFAVDFSIQDPATDTLSLGPDDAPLRDSDGRLLLRPGGHGALLSNLANVEGDLLLIRNIDNVVPEKRQTDNLLWDRLLGGLLLELVDARRALLDLLRRTPDDPAVRRWATAFLRSELGMTLPGGELDAGQLAVLLDRPLRVCGMVRNSGEPGGGPFWVRGTDGVLSRQIVEAAQVNRDDPQQAAVFAAATHFNPVDVACNLRDSRGYPYDLPAFIDDEAAIVTEKVQNGQPVRVLERPGLWNGGMAGWHTIFVELPETTFNPVKTVFDLLRPAHQP